MKGNEEVLRGKEGALKRNVMNSKVASWHRRAMERRRGSCVKNDGESAKGNGEALNDDRKASICDGKALKGKDNC